MRRYKPLVSALAAVVLAGGGALGVASAPAGATAGSAGGFTPAWARHTQLSGAALTAARILASPDLAAGQAAVPVPPGCPAGPSPSGNVMVNCLAEDGRAPNNTQSETSEAAIGKTVVVGFNDSLVCCKQIDISGYSVSRNGGRGFTDKGVLPLFAHNQPLGDPAVAAGTDGSFYYASLALSELTAKGHSMLSFYRMAPGQSRFHLLSVPVDVGGVTKRFDDKEYLAIGRDANGRQHFYLTWTLFTAAVPSVIMLTDSTDGVHWRTHPVSAADGCSTGSHPVPAGGTVYVSWEQSVPEACTVQNPNPHALGMMAAVRVATGAVLRRTVIAQILGSGDAIVNCNGPTDFREVIQTAPGHDVRNPEWPTTTIDRNGVLYAAWNDRPGGVGGSPSNATRIRLSVSRDGDRTWSRPAVISGPVSPRVVTDRFQPWITAGGGALHAMWYQRVGNLIQADAENLSLATASAGPVPGPEVRVSTVRFPVIQTNPNQDPVLSNCYMGDYNNIASANGTQYISWGDNRNIVKTTQGTEHQPDVFLAIRH
jgi:hypothetical protein